jgi:hypothetical protein
VEDSGGFITGQEGLARFASLGPSSLRKASSRCWQCHKRIVAYRYSVDPIEMPGCSHCHECGHVYCTDCQSSTSVEGWKTGLATCPDDGIVLRRFLWGEHS